MSKLKISTRVTFLALMLCLLSLCIGGMGLYGLSQANDALESLYNERLATTADVSKIHDLLLQQRLHLATGLITPDPEVIKENTASIEKNIVTIASLWADYQARITDPEEKELAQRFYAHRVRFLNEAVLPTVQALRAGAIDSAYKITTQTARPLFVPVAEGIESIVRWQSEASKKSFDEAEGRYALIRNTTIAALVSGILFALWFAATLVRGISRSLGHAVGVSRSIANGNLNDHIETHGKDEAAQVLHALSAMQQQLRTIATQIRANSDSVASASGQISQGNQDLAERTERQASSLQQTAAAMEQLASTVQHNAENAHQAQELAVHASDVAVQSGKLISDVVQTMNEINQSSQKIADIIGVIDGIAFQTNILALNAAVEAARAGTSGRGFAVVASEVRALAQRSAEASKEIKTIIEAGSQRTDRGTQLVSRAGHSMQEAVTAIGRVSALMTDISAASKEQSNGVGQIGIAVQQLDQTTQQNASLVEELSSAAASLQDQAHAQVRAVSVFSF